MIGEGPSARPNLDDGTSGRFNAVNDRVLNSFIVQKIFAVFVTATFISWQEIAPRIRRRCRACRKAPTGRTGRTAELINEKLVPAFMAGSLTPTMSSWTIVGWCSHGVTA